MIKRIKSITLLAMAVFFLQGCHFGELSEEKVRDLEYTVVPEEDIPEELRTIINEKKEQTFELSYAADGDLYIAIGYGKQSRGGYSIVVEELYAKKDSIMISTNLMGPEKDEKVERQPTYPYLVIKTEYLDVPVEYDGIINEFSE